MARKPLSDETKKQMTAMYADCGSINKVAKAFGVGWLTVDRAIKENEALTNLLEQKKQENTQDMLTFLDERKWKVQKLIDMCLDIVVDEDKLKKCRPTELMTTMAIGIDKFTAVPNQDNAKAGNLIEAIQGKAGEIYSDDENGEKL